MKLFQISDASKKYTNFILVLFTCCQLLQNVACRNGNSIEDIAENGPEMHLIKEEIDSWMSKPSEDISNLPFHLRQIITTLNQSVMEHHLIPDSTDRVFTGSISYCGPCRIVASLVIGYLRLGGPFSIMANFLSKVCYLFVYQSTKVCKGIVFGEEDSVTFIVKNTNVNAEQFCSLALGSYGCGPFKGPSWNVAIHPSRSHASYHSDIYARFSTSRHFNLLYNRRLNHRSIDFSPPKAQSYSIESSIEDNFTKKRQQIVDGKKVLKVLHLTDPHFDPSYTVGSNAVCEAPVCCNSDSGVVTSPENRAGRWGDYRNCDSPKWLLENMLSHINAVHPDVDYVICTGDLVPHNLWKVTRQENVHVIEEMVNMMRYFFPEKKIYGAIGNHESAPRDSYPPPEMLDVFEKFGNQWLYNLVSDGWEKLAKQKLPDTTKFGGYYSILIRPGFRLISINSNFCYILNWWVLLKPIDPGNVLNWLSNELHKAEVTGELVHIIGHIPPFYSDCYAQWAHQFSRLISRYSHIVKGQFYGHSHLDEYRIHYDVKNPRRPVGVEYVTPNNGPFNDLNPSYRIFYIDGDYPGTTRNVLDYETWVMNLTHANLYDDPSWYRLYSARKDLQMTNLSPRSWDRLAKRLAKNPALFSDYYRYQVQDSEPLLYKGCDSQCKRNVICAIIDGDAFMPKKCRP